MDTNNYVFSEEMVASSTMLQSKSLIAVPPIVFLKIAARNIKKANVAKVVPSDRNTSFINPNFGR